jgi:hypothetical protein
MNIAFVLTDVGLSGGVIVALRHASRLGREHGHQVSIVTIRGTTEGWVQREFPDLKIEPLDSKDVQSSFFDVAIATFWETLFVLEQVPSSRYVWFAQSIEDRFYAADNPIGAIAAAAIEVPIAVITEAIWIHDVFRAINPRRTVAIARNGIDKEIFSETDRPPSLRGESLRVLIEGPLGSFTKDVESSIRGALTAQTDIRISHVATAESFCSDPRYSALTVSLSFQEMADAFQTHDVLVKTSRVEGMYGPPLEAFHCGCVVVTTPVTGHEEFIVDGVNSIVVGWDDPEAIGAALDQLNRDRALLDHLKNSSRETAKAWPSLSESTSEFQRALEVCLATGSTETDEANLTALRVVRALRFWQLKMHVQLVQSDRMRREERELSVTVEAERVEQVSNLLSEIEAMKRTVSWSLTAPLRWVRRKRTR